MFKILAFTLESVNLNTEELDISIPEFNILGPKATRDPLDILTEVCKTNPAIIIIDDDLIYPNSLQVLKSIKRIKPKVPIIFFTSNNSVEMGHQVNLIGVKHYLIKPISNNELKEVLISTMTELNSNSKYYFRGGKYDKN